jgi:hypothetical protein
VNFSVQRGIAANGLDSRKESTFDRAQIRSRPTVFPLGLEAM